MGQTRRNEARKVLEAGRRARISYRLLLRQEESGQRQEEIQRTLADLGAAERLISSLEDLGQRAVLRLRYLEGLRWPEVFCELEKLGLFYCERHVYRIHARALESAGHCMSAPGAANLESESGGRGGQMGGSKKAADSAQGRVLREILSQRLPAGEKAAANLEELGLKPTYENAISLALADKAVKSGDLSAVKYIGDLLGASADGEAEGPDLSALSDDELRAMAARCAPKRRGRKAKSP